jgi:hypothetical protein
MCEPGSPENVPRAERIAGRPGVPSRSDLGEGHVDIEKLDKFDAELPGVREDGMSGRNGQRKPGTTRGSPRRSRTAKASRISRHAVKSRCARGWGGWGRLSVDELGQHNLVQSEGPWGGGRTHPPRLCTIESSARLCAGLPKALRGARRAKANQSSVSACREQA